MLGNKNLFVHGRGSPLLELSALGLLLGDTGSQELVVLGTR